MTVVLDANVMIASLQPDHVHHATVMAILDGLEADGQGKIAEIHRVNLAEVLVWYTDPYERTAIYNRLVDFGGLRICDIPAEEEVALLVRARQMTGVKMPDACVLATAIWFADGLMTFDKRLARAAAKVGVTTIDLT